VPAASQYRVVTTCPRIDADPHTLVITSALSQQAWEKVHCSTVDRAR
jgi:hypothetical protein